MLGKYLWSTCVLVLFVEAVLGSTEEAARDELTRNPTNLGIALEDLDLPKTDNQTNYNSTSVNRRRWATYQGGPSQRNPVSSNNLPLVQSLPASQQITPPPQAVNFPWAQPPQTWNSLPNYPASNQDPTPRPLTSGGLPNFQLKEPSTQPKNFPDWSTQQDFQRTERPTFPFQLTAFQLPQQTTSTPGPSAIAPNSFNPLSGKTGISRPALGAPLPDFGFKTRNDPQSLNNQPPTGNSNSITFPMTNFYDEDPKVDQQEVNARPEQQVPNNYSYPTEVPNSLYGAPQQSQPQNDAPMSQGEKLMKAHNEFGQALADYIMTCEKSNHNGRSNNLGPFYILTGVTPNDWSLING